MFVPSLTHGIGSANLLSLPPFPLWLYKYLAIFPVTGLLGLDHFALGSQFSGMAKAFVNLITLGSWYAYDIVQVYNSHNLRRDGLQIPFLESGSIGKGRIDDEPASMMTKNTKLWLYVLVLALFGGLYFITSFFISNDTDLTSTIIYYISSASFYASLGILLFIVYYYFTAKTTNLFAGATTKTNAVANLQASTGVSSLVGPQNAVTSLLSQSMPSMTGLSATKSMFSMLGGGNMNEIKNIAQEVMNGGAKESFQHIYFGLIVALIPISGFIIYTLRKYKKSSYEVSA